MPEFHQAVYVISVAAELAGVHPQTLRIYERKGLVAPARTGGGSRRYSDADIDLLSGTITFKEPVLSRDADLNPQFIVIDYEVDETVRGGEINAGLRADYTTANGKLRIGASAITDTGSGGADATRTNLAALDLRAKPSENTEVRAEVGVSKRSGDTATA